MSKRETKRQYVAGILFMGDALRILMFEHSMERNDALRYLEK